MGESTEENSSRSLTSIKDETEGDSRSGTVQFPKRRQNTAVTVAWIGFAGAVVASVLALSGFFLERWLAAPNPVVEDNDGIKVDFNQTGCFGYPASPDCAPFELAKELSKDQSVVISGSGTIFLGLTGDQRAEPGPAGVNMGREYINGYTPLEQREIEKGTLTPGKLADVAEYVGALIAAFVPSEGVARNDFEPKHNRGINSSDLFLVGESRIYRAPEDGYLFLGINDMWVVNGDRNFVASIK